MINKVEKELQERLGKQVEICLICVDCDECTEQALREATGLKMSDFYSDKRSRIWLSQIDEEGAIRCAKHLFKLCQCSKVTCVTIWATDEDEPAEIYREELPKAA